MADDPVTKEDDESGTRRGVQRMRARELGDPAFQALLARLGQEPDPAEGVYERLRTRLIAYLRLHLPAEADDLADLTLDRMARRIHEGTAVQNVYLYALGIARMLVFEARARFSREQSALDEAARLEAGATVEGAADNAETEAVSAALEACLHHIGQSASALILAYYADEGAARIEKRRRLATELGLSVNALRNRALRLREMLEHCVRGRLGWRDGSPLPGTSDDSNATSGP